MQGSFTGHRAGGAAGVAAAFELNTPSNRERFGNKPAGFEAALRSVAAFAALLGPAATRCDIAPTPTTLPDTEDGKARVTVAVSVATAPEPTLLEWHLEREPSAPEGTGWQTARVGFAVCA